MARRARVWWWKPRGYWVTDLGGRRIYLAKGYKNKKVADAKFKQLQEEQALLAEVDGAITVARLCEEFLIDAEEHLATKTYESYRYGCQMFVDEFGARNAHTICPQDIAKFSRVIKARLNPTSQAIVLRSVQRCFNWGVEEQLIPEHKLGKVRKPTALARDRFLTDEEFQEMLRATNPKNGHRSGASFRRILLALDWTLCRPGEIIRLKWEHIHMEQEIALLPEHKTRRTTRKPKIIPLIPKMRRMLEWLQKQSVSEYCFVNFRGEPWTLSAVEQRMAHLRERANLTGQVVPYTLRHRAATNTVLKTGDLKMTSLLLGHTSTQTTERYTHLAQEHLVSFAKRANGSLKRA